MASVNQPPPALEAAMANKPTFRTAMVDKSKMDTGEGVPRDSQVVVLPSALLKEFPLWLVECTELAELSLSYAKELKAIPEEFGSLSKLERLWLGNSGYVSLPESFGRLTALKVLSLGGCVELTALPESVGDMKSLEVLDLLHCPSIITLPDSICHLPALKTLSVALCKKLTALPADLGQIQTLEQLHTNQCIALTEWPDLSGLKGLDIFSLPEHAKPWDEGGRVAMSVTVAAASASA